MTKHRQIKTSDPLGTVLGSILKQLYTGGIPLQEDATVPDDTASIENEERTKSFG